MRASPAPGNQPRLRSFDGGAGSRRSARIASPRLTVQIQLATTRRGVPHARSLRYWANMAYAHSAPRARAGNATTELTLRVVSGPESRRLNARWRGKDKPTNVLSFPSGTFIPGEAATELGDIIICAPVVAREAREQGKPLRAHWAHMIVHGTLHLLGFDHEREREARHMEACEVAILESFGYPTPYHG